MNNFSSFLFFDNLKYQNKKFIDEVLNNFDIRNPTRDTSWNCYVETNHHSKNKPNIPKNLKKILNKKVNEFGKSLKNNFFHSLKIDEIWYNVYTKNMYQELHTHRISLFSGIFYLKFNKNIHSPTIFYNNFFNIDFCQETYSDINIFCFKPEINEGDLIIFPSNILHEVKPQTTDELRITIAFNTTCSEIEIKKYPINSKIFY